MDDFVIAIYCFCDDFCKKTEKKEDVKRKLNNAEIIVTAIVSAKYFGCNLTKARHYMSTHWGCKMPHKSNFNKMLHRLTFAILSIFRFLGNILKDLNLESRYIIDSFPVAVCKNIRINRCRLLQGEAYRGFNNSKKEYFYGFKVQVITTADGIPVDFFICAGSFHDIAAFKSMNIDLPPNSKLFADKAYTDYEIEDLLLECENIQLMAHRKSNSKRKDSVIMANWKKQIRRIIETSFSSILALFPKSVHSVTPQGFLLKIMLFIVAFTFSKMI